MEIINMKPFKYLEAPENFLSAKKEEMDEFYSNAIYLGGNGVGIDSWEILQENAIKHLIKIFNVINPLKRHFLESNIKDIKFKLDWERDNIRKCKNILFVFGPEDIDSITAFEFGAALERNDQNIYICCDKLNSRSFEIEYQAHKKWKPVYSNLGETIAKICQYIK